MQLNVAVQMDPLDQINSAGDSTFALMLAGQARGHSLFHYTAEDLNYADGRVWAKAHPFTVQRPGAGAGDATTRGGGGARQRRDGAGPRKWAGAARAKAKRQPQGGRAVAAHLTKDRFGRVPRADIEATRGRSVVPAAQKRMQELVPGAARCRSTSMSETCSAGRAEKKIARARLRIVRLK